MSSPWPGFAVGDGSDGHPSRRIDLLAVLVDREPARWAAVPEANYPSRAAVCTCPLDGGTLLHLATDLELNRPVANRARRRRNARSEMDAIWRAPLFPTTVTLAALRPRWLGCCWNGEYLPRSANSCATWATAKKNNSVNTATLLRSPSQGSSRNQGG